MKTGTCKRCEVSFEYEPYVNHAGVELFPNEYCDPCSAAMDEEDRAAKEAKKTEEHRLYLISKWREICPPIYQETNADDPRMSQKVREALERFDPSSGRFLGLCGSTGKGKTRLSFHRLQTFHMRDWNVFAISAKRFERAVHHQFHDDKLTAQEAQSLWNDTRESQLVLLDDVGKEKFTERVAGEFYDLVEYRSSHKLPMIWTANLGPKDLEQRLGQEYGSATLRRLVEFSEIIIA